LFIRLFYFQDEIQQTQITSQSLLIVQQIDTSSNQQIPTIRRNVKVN
jgi:hypothetical protein